MYSCITLRCSHIAPAVWKMDGWMIQPRALSSVQMQEFIRRTTHIVHYGYSNSHCAYIDCTLLRCIAGLIMSLNNVHYCFGLHYKWLSLQIVPYLRLYWVIWTQTEFELKGWI